MVTPLLRRGTKRRILLKTLKMHLTHVTLMTSHVLNLNIQTQLLTQSASPWQQAVLIPSSAQYSRSFLYFSFLVHTPWAACAASKHPDTTAGNLCGRKGFGLIQKKKKVENPPKSACFMLSHGSVSMVSSKLCLKDTYK